MWASKAICQWPAHVNACHAMRQRSNRMDMVNVLGSTAQQLHSTLLPPTYARRLSACSSLSLLHALQQGANDPRNAKLT